MKVFFEKGQGRHSRLFVERADGSSASMNVANQAFLPQDVIHLVVEQTLGFREAYFGQVARGELAYADEAGSLEDFEAEGAEVRQVAAIVETLESALRSGNDDLVHLEFMTEAACKSRSVPVPEISELGWRRMLARLQALSRQWIDLPVGGRLTLEFVE